MTTLQMLKQRLHSLNLVRQKQEECLNLSKITGQSVEHINYITNELVSIDDQIEKCKIDINLVSLTFETEEEVENERQKENNC